MGNRANCGVACCVGENEYAKGTKFVRQEKHNTKLPAFDDVSNLEPSTTAPQDLSDIGGFTIKIGSIVNGVAEPSKIVKNKRQNQPN